MLATLWQGCYQDTWQDSIVPEAFCHPAKFSRGLIHRIYRYLIAEGHIAAGTTVLDPFGGVALGAVDAMTYGLNWLGVELEPKFVALGKKNLELWRQRYGFRQGTLVQGDSRQLRSILQGTGVQGVVGSPPFSVSGCQPTGRGQGVRSDYAQGLRTEDSPDSTYGTSPGQLGVMPPGAVISSPPYVGSVHDGNGIDHTKLTGNRPGPHTQAAAEGYGTTPGQLGAMPPGAVVSSPPYAEAISNGRSGIDKTKGVDPRKADSMAVRRIEELAEGYGTTPGQLGAEPTTFWSASGQIMQEVAAILPAGAVCAWVVKSYVKNKAIVPFPDQWRQLCEQHGFVLIEEIHASLVEDHGTQEGLFGEAQRVTTEKKSFFRRLAEKKGSPRIDHETVLIVRKAGSGADVCCVSSPPYEGSNQDYQSGWGYIDMEKRAAGDPGRYADASYGTTPGNLGNLPVGVCCVSSPPFHDQFPSQASAEWHTARASIGDSNSLGRMQSYGTTPGNLGNLPVGRR